MRQIQALSQQASAAQASAAEQEQLLLGRLRAAEQAAAAATAAEREAASRATSAEAALQAAREAAAAAVQVGCLVCLLLRNLRAVAKHKPGVSCIKQFFSYAERHTGDIFTPLCCMYAGVCWAAVSTGGGPAAWQDARG